MTNEQDKLAEVMTVKNLIKNLSQYPENMCVVTHGYEGGYHDCPEPKTISIKRDVNSEWYYGPHDDADDNGEIVVLL